MVQFLLYGEWMQLKHDMVCLIYVTHSLYSCYTQPHPRNKKPKIRMYTTCAAFSPCSNMIATGTNSGTLDLHIIATNELTSTKVHDGYHSMVTSVCFSPDRVYMATTSVDTTAKVWDYTQSPPICKCVYKGSEPLERGTFTKNGQYLVMSTRDFPPSSIIVWNISTFACVKYDPAALYYINYAVSLDDKTIAIAKSTSIALRELMTGTHVGHINTGHGAICDVDFSPTNVHHLAVTSEDMTATIWDVGSITCLFTLMDNDIPYDCRFSSDGAFLVTSGKIWRVSTGEVIEVLKPMSLLGIDISPNGKYIGGFDVGQTVVARLPDIMFHYHYSLKVMMLLMASTGRFHLPAELWALIARPPAP